MLLFLAIILALLSALLTPLAYGLVDTSSWVTKVLEPEESKENEVFQKSVGLITRLAGNSALLEGWLSNIPFLKSVLLFSSIITGFFYSWWGGIVAYLVCEVLTPVFDLLWMRPLSFYLMLIHIKMFSRAADYRSKNDYVRAELAESYCKDLENLISLYANSNLRPPSSKRLKEIPRGNPGYWLDNPKGRY